MGKYDSLDRTYFTEQNRYAELISVVVFHGRIHLQGTDLELVNRTYPSVRNSTGTMERDGLLFCRSQSVFYGLEIENYADYRMPERLLVYDACEYEKQASDLKQVNRIQKIAANFSEMKSGMTKMQRLFPVINIVLYLGKGHWHGKRTLWDLFSVEEKWKKHLYSKMQNYSFSLMEAEYVDPNSFQTDLKIFFRAMQCRENKQRLQELIQDEEFVELSEETKRVILVHLGNRLMVNKVMEENADMCKALDDWAREEREAGRAEGYLNLLKKQICIKTERFLTVEEIARELEISPEEVIKIQGENRQEAD